MLGKWFKRKNKNKSEEIPREDIDAPVPSQDLGLSSSSESYNSDQEEEVDKIDSLNSHQEITEDALKEGEATQAASSEFPVSSSDPDELEEPVEEEAEEEIAEQEKGRFFKKLRQRMQKTRERLTYRMDRLVLGKKQIDMDLIDELEEILITSDLGVQTTQRLLDRVADKVRRKELKDPEKLRGQLQDQIESILSVPAPPWNPEAEHPFVVMVVGVNGVGKTTTIGKLAHQLTQEGLKVMLVAADTFRAAAVEQLTVWGERAGVPVVKQKSGSDPSAVAFDAMEAALARDIDVVLLDTAGRMHTKANLMEELKKIQRVVKKKIPSAPHEVLLVLDAGTGQNAFSQARLFKEEMGVTGLILTKLDGTAKGGIIVSICNELQVPVRYIGIGEALEDLRPFDPEQFTNAIF